MNIFRKVLGIQDLKFDDNLQRKVVSFPSSDWKVTRPKKRRFTYEFLFKHKDKEIQVRFYSDDNPAGYSYGGHIEVNGKVKSYYHDELYHSHPVGEYFNNVLEKYLREQKEKYRKEANEAAAKI